MNSYQKGMVLLLMIFLIGLIFLVYAYVGSMRNVMTAYAVGEFNFSNYEGGLQFYSDMRFPHNELSYSIDTNCERRQMDRMRQAFRILEERIGVLKFYELSFNELNSSDIMVSCSVLEVNESEDYVKVGEGGAYSIVPSGKFNVIEKGKISLFEKKSYCDFPNVEVHELLHVLGIKHLDSRESIMYNISNCDQIINQEIINQLSRLYILQELPDVAFYNFSVSKRFLYLDLRFVILNEGISMAENVSFDVYLGNKQVRSFQVGNINYGEGKIVSLNNLYSRGDKEIRVVLNGGNEFNYTNNLIVGEI